RCRTRSRSRSRRFCRSRPEYRRDFGYHLWLKHAGDRRSVRNREAMMTQMLRRHGFARACVCCSAPVAPASPARRNFLTGGLAALGLGAVGAASAVSAPAVAQAAKTRIDVHHHFHPKFHVDAMMAPGRRAGAPPPKWSTELSLEDMDKSGIQTSILSI